MQGWQWYGNGTHGTGMVMTTSVSSRYSCSSSYSMLTSHLPAFSDGQQLTVCVCVCACGETDEHRTDSTNEFNIIAEFNIVLSAASG